MPQKNGHLTNERREPPDKPNCFVIMPISDPDGYESGHFQHVFEDLFLPGCDKAGYKAIRADQVRQTNLIQLDVLQKIIDSPIVLCDLSSRNPNVLFELGLRQAFDKPVVLVQEAGTPPIFDITPLRFTNYSRELIYRDVLKDQEAIADALIATTEAMQDTNSVNSIVKLLGLTHAASVTTIKESDRDSAVLQVIMAELANLRAEIRNVQSYPTLTPKLGPYKKISKELYELMRIDEELADITPQISQLVHGEIITDFSELFENLVTKLAVIRSLLSSEDTEEVAVATELRHRLMRLKNRHDRYIKDTKLVPEF